MLRYPTPLLLSESFPQQLAPTLGHDVYRVMMQMVFSSIAGNRLISAADPSFHGMISRDQTITLTILTIGVPAITQNTHHTKGSGSCSSQLILFTIKHYNDLTMVYSSYVCTRAYTKGRLLLFRLVTRLPDHKASSSTHHHHANSSATPSLSAHTHTAANARPGSPTG